MPSKFKIIFTTSALAVFTTALLISPGTVLRGFAVIRSVFAAPTCDPSGTCSVLTTDGSGNFGIGANSDGASRLFIRDADTSATKFGLKIVSSDGSTPVFVVRNDGAVSLASSTYVGGRLCFGTMGTATDCVTSWSGVGGGVTSTPAGYVTPGYFNSVAGTGGNYSFPASLSVGTSTAPSGGVFLTNGNMKTSGTITATNGFSIENSNYVFGSGAYNFFKPYMSSPSASSEISTAKSLYINMDADNDETTNTIVFGHSGVGSSATKIMTLQENGNVAIGTDTAYARLHVVGGDIYILNNGNNPRFLVGDSTSGGNWGGFIWNSAGDYVSIGTDTGGMTTVNILETGNVGIGTVSPAQKLSVLGNIQIASSTAGLIFGDGTTQTTAAGAGTNYFTLSGTSLYPTSTAYNVGIGTTSPSYPLDVVKGTSFTDGGIRTKYALRFGTNGTSAAPVLFPFSGSGFTTPDPAGRGLGFYSYSTTAGDVGIGFSGESIAATSGANRNVVFSRPFSPTSGVGTYTNLNLTGTINQTGGANGITRGLLIDPTLTAAADWRSIEIANNGGYGIYQSGASAKNYFAGNVGVATSTPTYPLTVAGVIHSSTGGYRFPDGTTQTTAASAGVSLAGTNTWTGTNYFQSAPGSEATILTSNAWNLQSFSTDGGGAAMSFHRSGAYAVNMGLNPDNSFAIGGWSDGAVNRISIAANGNTTFGNTGTAKINVGTIDPPYTINGEQYATYLPGMIGQKEETTGEVRVTCPLRQSSSEASNAQHVACQTTIDFNTQEKGSDLWLFAKTTNLKNSFDKMTVLLTPSFDGRVWYEKDTKNNTLKIFASPVISDKSLVDSYSVSYRLTAPRFDSENWLNTRNDVGVDGFIIND